MTRGFPVLHSTAFEMSELPETSSHSEGFWTTVGSPLRESLEWGFAMHHFIRTIVRYAFRKPVTSKTSESVIFQVMGARVLIFLLIGLVFAIAALVVAVTDAWLLLVAALMLLLVVGSRLR